MAIVDKRVVASGRVISEVREEAMQTTANEHFPVIFSEKDIYVY